MIDFDNKFVSSEFYSVTSCSSSTNTLYENSPNCNTLKNIITDLTKGQLAGSVIVFVSYLMFVGIYIYIHTYIRALKDGGTNFGNIFPFHAQSAQKQINIIAPSAQASLLGYQ